MTSGCFKTECKPRVKMFSGLSQNHGIKSTRMLMPIELVVGV